MKSPQFLLAIGFSCLLPLQAFSEAPVVDDSENFAILDEQQAAMEQPVAKTQMAYNDADEDIALAQDNDTDNHDSAELLDKIKGMQQEIQELRGQLEVQTHDLKLLQQQQLAFYKDIDTRLNTSPTKLAQAQTPAPSTELNLGSTHPLEIQPAKTNPVIAAPTPAPYRANPAEEQISYLAAYDLVKNKHFDEALIAMQNFVTKYPQGGYTPNAQYWLGELYMIKKNYSEAIEHFEIVLTQFPSSSKAAACSLKIGYALDASGKKAEAKKRLQQVVKNYPDTPTAQLAATKLRIINAS